MYGLPPHVRGKETRQAGLLRAPGITPAYAGKRCKDGQDFVAVEDHPRVCGEKFVAPFCRYFTAGSPPRMRGKVDEEVGNKLRFGITPAYAGKSPRVPMPMTPAKDHPRVCGEKPCNLLFSFCHPGSPPRMRGKVNLSQKPMRGGRITPAYAGKRLKRSRSTVPPVAIVPLFPSVCNKPVVSDGSPAGRDAPLFLPAENAVPASPAYNLRSL